MNRKTTITICIVAIIMVTISLLGFTYGFYINRVIGNTNQKTIEAISGLEQVEIVDISNEVISDIIRPGYTYTKVFTVENTGDLDSTYSIYLMDVVNEFIRKEDIVYTLYRKDGNNTIDINNLSNEDIVTSGIYPSGDAIILKNEKLNNTGDFYTYALKVEYLYHENIDQNDDQGHRFKGVVHIYGTNNEVDNHFIGGTLAYEVLRNAKNVTSEEIALGYAEYIKAPKTTVAEKTSETNESTLSETPDDYTESTGYNSYYFRGNVKNNYVNFAGMCWRIVRIQGNGSVKLILEDSDESCSSSMDSNFTIEDNLYSYIQNGVLPVFEGDGLKSFQTGLNDYLDDLVSGNWCIGDNAYPWTSSGFDIDMATTSPLSYEDKYNHINNSFLPYPYEATVRIVQDKYTYKCNGTTLSEFSDGTEMYVGALTIDEAVYAGEEESYLIDSNTEDGWGLLTLSFNNFGNQGWYNYREDLKFRKYETWDDFYDSGFNVEGGYKSDKSRPVISLIDGTLITKGNGSINNPYRIL